jgi:hypothetical protein
MKTFTPAEKQEHMRQRDELKSGRVPSPPLDSMSQAMKRKAPTLKEAFERQRTDSGIGPAPALDASVGSQTKIPSPCQNKAIISDRQKEKR